VLEVGEPRVNRTARSAGSPWRIGWFGMSRKGLDGLSSVAREIGGAVEVIIRGRPSGKAFKNFDKAVSSEAHVHYTEPYQNPTDLPEIYGDVHFVSPIDYYEIRQNSAGLLPDRIYEGSASGAVPIALAVVETSAWLAKHSVGIVLHEPLQDRLIKFFQNLDQVDYERLVRAVDTLLRVYQVSDRADCCELVQALCGPAKDRTKVSSMEKLQ
jgi:succinoglycan biosynthesis protein ExoL